MKQAIQIGAGNIGRGFMGALLEQAGWHVTFADVVESSFGTLTASSPTARSFWTASLSAT